MNLYLTVFCKQDTRQDMFCYSEHGSVNIQLEEDTWHRGGKEGALKMWRKLKIMRTSKIRKKCSYDVFMILFQDFFYLKWDSYADLLCSTYGSPSPDPNLHIPTIFTLLLFSLMALSYSSTLIHFLHFHKNVVKVQPLQ